MIIRYTKFITVCLDSYHVHLRLYAATHQATRPTAEVLADCVDGAELQQAGARLRATPAGGHRLDRTSTVMDGRVEQAAVGLATDFTPWSAEDWVFMPACVYAGNRFPQVTSKSGWVAATPPMALAS